MKRQQKTINKLCIAVLLCLVGGAIAAQQSAPAEKYGCPSGTPGGIGVEKGAVCMPTGRSSDPFVFCTQGMPKHGWVSVNPLAGVWFPITWKPNTMWVPTFQTICPKVRQMGNWQGDGAPSLTPYSH